ncbi:Luciferin 4-monooxygenase [Gryllus bimaculatus]|nr:Luciferin 4-monooxygenase [Gryllus bimaculatus]
MHQIQHPEVAHIRQTEGDFQDVIPAVLPFFHIYGMVVVLLNSLCMGAKVVSLPKFDPAGFVRTMIEKKATGLFAGAAAGAVPGGPPVGAGRTTLASLRFVLCGAAPLAAADAERLLSRASHHIDLVQGYGMTEASPVLTQGRKGFMGAVGPPVPATEAVVINMDTLSSVPHGQEGELCFRGPQKVTEDLSSEELIF